MSLLQPLRVKGDRGVSYPIYLEQIHFLEYYQLTMTGLKVWIRIAKRLFSTTKQCLDFITLFCINYH